MNSYNIYNKKELENRNIDGEYLSKVIGVIHSEKLTKKQIRDWFSEYAGLHHIKITIQGIGYLISEGDFQYLICEEVASPYSADYNLQIMTFKASSKVLNVSWTRLPETIETTALATEDIISYAAKSIKEGKNEI